jgi:hypothetical protein
MIMYIWNFLKNPQTSIHIHCLKNSENEKVFNKLLKCWVKILVTSWKILWNYRPGADDIRGTERSTEPWHQTFI